MMTGVNNGKKARREACPRSAIVARRVAGGKSFDRAMIDVMTISPTPTRTPGTIPARNSAATDSPMT